jgi:hypothetical protein
MGRRRKESTTTTHTARLGVYLTDDMFSKLRVAAAEDGTSLTALVEELVAEYLRKRSRKHMRKK